MNILIKLAVALVILVVVLAGVAWLGLQIQPRPFAAYPEPGASLVMTDLPAGLPAPVARYYQTIMPNGVPVVHSAVMTGRGTLRFMGIRFPARWRFTHDAGRGYRHYIEAMVFGYPLMKVNEWYLDERGRLELPVGVIDNDPKVNSAANLGLWGESFVIPSIFLTDPRVRWEPIDDQRARLVVPAGDGEDSFTVTFDPETGLVQSAEALRWKDPNSTEQTRWQIGPLSWEVRDGIRTPAGLVATWEDEGTPWLRLTLEELVYNVDVTAYIRATGP